MDKLHIHIILELHLWTVPKSSEIFVFLEVGQGVYDIFDWLMEYRLLRIWIILIDMEKGRNKWYNVEEC